MEPNRTRRGSRLDAWKPLAVFLLLCLAGCAYLFFVRLPWRDAYFMQRQLREVATISDQIHAALEGRLEGLEQAARHRTRGRRRAVGLIPSLTLVEDAKCLPDPSIRLSRESTLHVEHSHRFPQETNPPYWDRAFKEIGAEIKGDAEVYFRFACDVRIGSPRTPEPMATPVQRVDLTLHYAGDPAITPTRTATFPTPSSASVAPTATPTATTPASCADVKDTFLCAKASLATLIEGALSDSRLHRYDIVIANRAGEIVFERGPRALRLENILKTGAEVSKPGEPSKEGVTNSRSRLSYPVRMGLPPLELLQRTSHAERVRLADADYRLFSQPLDMPRLWAGGTDVRDDEVWVVAVLVPEDAFQADVQHVSYGSVSSAPLLLLLLLLLTPILKIFLVGSRSRLRKRDLHVAVLGLVLGSGVVAVLFNGHVAYLRLEGYLDADLQSWSEKLREGFRKDLANTSAALDAFVVEPPNCPICVGDPQFQCEGGDAVRKRMFHPNNPVTDCRFSTIAGKQPNLQMLLQTDIQSTDEPQLQKWTPFESATPLLKTRSLTEPFSERWKGHTALWREADGCRMARPFLLSSTRSRTTGQMIAVFERPGDEAPPARNHVAVPDLISFAPLVTPAGFGFAVVEAGGRVVFHSSHSRNLVENFLTEVDEPDRVSAAMAAHVDRWVETYYHGRLHRLYVHPLKDTAWTLVAFRDKELLRSIDFDVMLTWLLAFLLYAALTLVVLQFHFWLLGSRDSGWMWPDRSRIRVYWACTVVLAVHVVLAVLCLLGYGSNDGWNMTISAFALPFSGYGFCVAVLVSVSPRPVGSEVSWRPVVVGVGVVGGLLCFLLLVGGLGKPLFGIIQIVSTTVGALYAWLNHRVDRDFSETRRPFVVLSILSLVLFGMIPALALYKDAFDLGVETLIRHGQMHLANGMAQREHLIHHDGRDWKGSGLLERRLEETADIPPRGLFWGGQRVLRAAIPTPMPSRGWCGGTGSCLGRMAEYVLRDHNTRTTYLSTTDPGEGQESNLLAEKPCTDATTPIAAPATPVEARTVTAVIVPSPTPTSDLLLARRCEGARCDAPLSGKPLLPLWSLLQRHPTGMIMQSLPTWNQAECIETRHLVFEDGADGTWQSWRRRSADGEHLCLGVYDPRFDIDAGTGRRKQIQMCSAIPLIALGRNLPKMYWVIGVLAAGLFLWIVHTVLIGLGERTMALRDDRPPSPRFPPKPWHATGLFLVDPPPGVAERVRAWFPEESRIDLHQGVPERGSVGDLLEYSPPVGVHVDNLGHRLDDAQWNRDKLGLLEDLVLGSRKKVVVISRVDPLVYLRERLQSAGYKADSSYVTEEELDRWARVLERLACLSPGFYSGDDTHVVHGLEQLFEAISGPGNFPDGWHETKGTGRLEGIGRELAVLFRHFDAEDRPMVIRHACRAHYRTIWSSLTDRERLILHHVADEGFENLDEESWRFARPLLRRGYLRFQPELALMNESFRSFVRSETETKEEVLALERADGASWWEQVRNVLVPSVIVLGLLLAQIRPELLTIMVGTLTTLTTAGAAVGQLLGLVGPSARRRDASS